MYSDRRVTHVRLNIHPDGGVARLRVHGTVLPDPRLARRRSVRPRRAGERRRVTGVSNEFYGRPQQLIGRGLARNMGEGWETARRRDTGNDWVEVTLACEGVVTPGRARHLVLPAQRARNGLAHRRSVPTARSPLLPRTRLQPDTRHRFVLADAPAVDRVRLDVFPDGGMARLRLWGRPTAAGRAALGRRWFDALPDVQALEVLGSVGVPPQQAGRVVGARPLGDDVPPEVARLVLGPG